MYRGSYQPFPWAWVLSVGGIIAVIIFFALVSQPSLNQSASAMAASSSPVVTPASLSAGSGPSSPIQRVESPASSSSQSGGGFHLGQIGKPTFKIGPGGVSDVNSAETGGKLMQLWDSHSSEAISVPRSFYLTGTAGEFFKIPQPMLESNGVQMRMDGKRMEITLPGPGHYAVVDSSYQGNSIDFSPMVVLLNCDQ